MANQTVQSQFVASQYWWYPPEVFRVSPGVSVQPPPPGAHRNALGALPVDQAGDHGELLKGRRINAVICMVPFDLE